ncbi:MAG: hypothetical protein K6E13_11505, partial [Lachnospiraceae bacterium]|nr:hypothetical protein [Lachnospiraceae bacterium]
RSLVRSTAEFNENHFADWDGFERKVNEQIPKLNQRSSGQKCGLEYRNISGYLKPIRQLNDEIRYINEERRKKGKSKLPYYKSLASMYEDNKTINNKRYGSAKASIAGVLNEGAKYDFRKNEWKISCMQNRDLLRY